TRSGGVDQPFRLGQLTGMAASFRRSIVLADGGEFGLSLLSRHPIIRSEKIELTSTGEQRVAVIWQVELAEDGFAVDVGVTHLGLDAAERTTQAAELADFVSGRSHLLLAGDFNEVPDGG